MIVPEVIVILIFEFESIPLVYKPKQAGASPLHPRYRHKKLKILVKLINTLLLKKYDNDKIK